MEDDRGTRSFFIRGFIIVIVSILFFFFGSLFSLEVISFINKTTPADLLKGNIRGQHLPDLQERQESKLESLSAFNDAINKVAEDVTPSVVNVRVKVMQEDIFGNKQEQEGVGSGVVYTNDGYIITNSHVAGEAIELTVTLSDGSEYPAKLVGADENTDIAVIKIDAKDLKPANFTSIENVKVGEVAIALGSPFGLQESVTMGVVSALGRDIPISTETLPMVDLIQTDATINPGNSGGPLANSAGQVIGINTLIFSSSGTSSGIGFAIPSDTAVNIARQIIKFGKAKIPFIGIEMVESSSNVKGVYVNSAVAGYPAEKAGIRSGDIITEFNGKKVETQFQLLAQILRHNVGDSIELSVYRSGNYLKISLVLVESPAAANQ
jgi:serine protease Do